MTTMEDTYIPATMLEARKHWREHTRHVVTDDIALVLKRDGVYWNEDTRGPYIQVEDIRLRFWKRRSAGNDTVYCGVALY